MSSVRAPRHGSILREQMWIGCSLAVVLSTGFYGLDWINAARFNSGEELWDIAIGLDGIIPFQPEWIWMYLLYFPICFLPLCFREVRRDIGVFRRTALGFSAQFLLAFPFFLLFPLQMVRPEFSPATVSESALYWFYGIDPGFNILPSLHVANTAFLACLTGRLRGIFPGLALWTFCLLTALSALFVKQHYLVDLPAGLFLGIFCYRLAFSRALDVLEPPRIRSKIPMASLSG